MKGEYLRGSKKSAEAWMNFEGIAEKSVLVLRKWIQWGDRKELRILTLTRSLLDYSKLLEPFPCLF